MPANSLPVRIKSLLAVYVLVTVLPGTAFAYACRALFSDEAVAVRHMRAHNISHLERIPGMFEILPQGKHPLNLFAAKIKVVYGGVLVYFPRALREGGGRAYATSFLQPDGSRVPALFMATETLLGEGRPLRDLINLHELRHLRFQLELRARKASPFYGDMMAKKGLIPDELVADSKHYRDRMSFEELKTFSAQLQHSLTVLRGALRAGGDAKAAKEALDDAFDIAGTLMLISHRSRLVLDRLDAELARDPALMKFEVREGFVWGLVPGLKFGENVVDIALPLVTAKTEKDANVRELFLAQKNLLREAADERFNLFQYLRAGQEMLAEPKYPVEHRVLIIDELQKALGKLRH